MAVLLVARFVSNLIPHVYTAGAAAAGGFAQARSKAETAFLQTGSVLVWLCLWSLWVEKGN